MIEASGLSKRYGDRLAVDGLSLLAAGELQTQVLPDDVVHRTAHQFIPFG